MLLTGGAVLLTGNAGLFTEDCGVVDRGVRGC